MKSEDVHEIIECLSKGRTIYPYHKDRYAVQLLEYAVGKQKQVADIRSSRFGKLLNRPIVQDVVAQCGNGLISTGDLATAWLPDTESYRLTLGVWGSHNKREWDQCYYQTSRPGQNLVLQLNFSDVHDAEYKRRMKCGKRSILNYCGHPVHVRRTTRLPGHG